MRRKDPTPQSQIIRCAIYTRKSTEEGLEQEFNTLDAQRESGEAFIASQKHDGWVLVADRYDDGGFTGGNMERPALRRLFAEIEAGNIDCVVVYKVDRLSRSLLDFARMMEVFERRNVSFVSVTQQFNTAASMGRLILNVLLSFAQFEREMISERTRDKIAATRRKGKWSGGMPLLGYDVVDAKLVVLPAEAEQVRQIFELYLERQSLLATVEELNQRGWTTKQWTTKKSIHRGGLLFGKTRLHKLLTNVTYRGKIRYKDEVHEGEHEAIIDVELFDRVQQLLDQKGNGQVARNGHRALLSGLVRCAACDCGMVHTYTSKGTRRYRYYVCAQAQQRGWSSCPAPSLSAREVERFVVEQIRCIGRDPALMAATLVETRRQTDKAIQALKQERAALERKRRVDAAEIGRIGAVDGPGTTKQAAFEERMAADMRRIADIGAEISGLAAGRLEEADVASALAEFDAVWEMLTPREQATTIELLIEQVTYDAATDHLELTLRPTGLKSLAHESATPEETAA